MYYRFERKRYVFTLQRDFGAAVKSKFLAKLNANCLEFFTKNVPNKFVVVVMCFKPCEISEKTDTKIFFKHKNIKSKKFNAKKSSTYKKNRK
jgi:hypothetical protein